MCANAMFIAIYESLHWSEKSCCWRRGLFTIPWTKFSAVPVWNFKDSEPLLSQVLTIHLCGGKISVKFTSSDSIVNNFANGDSFYNYWNAVSQVKQILIAWKNYQMSKFMIPNHVFIQVNPKKRPSSRLKLQPWS